MIKKIKEIFNIVENKYKYYNTNINYCGTFERQAFFTKWVPLHKIFPGINLACFYHDCRYNILFKEKIDQRKEIIKLLFLKFVVDTIFLYEMLRFAGTSKFTLRYPQLVAFRTIMSILFYFIVILATPYYAYIFAKRQKKNDK